MFVYIYTYMNIGYHLRSQLILGRLKQNFALLSLNQELKKVNQLQLQPLLIYLFHLSDQHFE